MFKHRKGLIIMKKNVLKIASLLLIVAMLFSFVACGDKNNEEETTVPEETEEVDVGAETTLDNNEDDVTDETEDGATDVSEEDSTVAPTENSTEASTETQTGTTTTEASSADLPSTNAEILAAYTQVMNKAKTDKPAYSKLEYQEIPDNANDRDIREGKGLINTLLNVASNFFTPKDKAEVEVKEKGSDMRYFPVYKTGKGCLLTDTSMIKNASCVQLDNGNYKITLALKDEKNPEPPAENATTSPSAHGAVFSPLSKNEIDDTLKNNTLVSLVVKDIVYDLTYKNSVATLEYNPNNMHVVKLEHIMVVEILGSGKVVFSSFDLTQNLYNTSRFYDFAY